MKNTSMFAIWVSILAVVLGCGGKQNRSVADTPAAADLPIGVNVTVHLDQVKRRAPRSFMGINLSYFNDTDDIWAECHIEDKLRSAGIGALRYPGGEETSFFHWQHPGVNGYEDIHDDPAVFGNPRGRGPFQVTWVAPDQWDKNTRFMDFDEFMAHCKSLGAEPVVGLNLSCGRRFNRRAAGLQEALDWMDYCKQKGYRVTYWYLDNEPWNNHAAYTFRNDEYAEDVLYYGKAIKQAFPDVKLIVNPASSETINHTKGIKHFIETTGGVIDYIDMHWYWSWGTSSWQKWLTQSPMTSGDQWKDDWMDRPYAQDVGMIRKLCEDAGYPDIGVMALEWNVGPSEQTRDLPDTDYALIQSEMLMEFLDADVKMTCLWTLLWQSRRDVWSVQDRFQSIVTHEPPHKPTATLEAMRMFSSLLGSDQVAVDSTSDDLRVTATVSDDAKTTHLLLLNKHETKRTITIHFDPPVKPALVNGEYIDRTHGKALPLTGVNTTDSTLAVDVEPFSLTCVHIQHDAGG